MADNTFIYAGSETGAMYRKEAGDDDWKRLGKPVTLGDAGMEGGLCPQPEVRAIAIHPKNPDTVYAGTQRGVYLSKDRGDTWKRADMDEGMTVWSMAFRPDNPNVMFLGTQGNLIYRSDDAGESWKYVSTIINPDHVQMQFAVRILGMDIEPNNPDVMYSAMEVGGIARSLDAGKTWEMVNHELKAHLDLLDLHAVAVGSPSSDAAFISNRTGVWRTRNRGDSWENTHIENFSDIVYSRCVRVAPDDPNTLYACVGLNFGAEQGGVMRSTDLGETWERFDHGVSPKSTGFGVAANAQHPEQVFFCTRKAEIYGTNDGGATWKEHPLPEGAKDLISIAVASA